MSAGSSTFNSGLPLQLRELKNVYYDGGVPWMLIPDDEGVIHIAILTEISPPETRNVAANVRLDLYTKYVLVCFLVLKTNVEMLSGSERHVSKTPQTLVGVPGNIRYVLLPNTS